MSSDKPRFRGAKSSGKKRTELGSVTAEGCKPSAHTIDVTNIDYSTSKSFLIASAGIIAILIALYATWR